MIYLTCQNIPESLDTKELYTQALAAFAPNNTNAEYVEKLFCRIEKNARQSLFALLLLAKLLNSSGASARSLTLARNEYGKPYFKDSELEFNVSHSGEYVAVALSNEGAVGVDIETADVSAEKAVKLAKRFFTEAERKAVEKCSSSFCELWSAKEAKAKYLGVSLASFIEFERSEKTDAAHSDISAEKYTACGVSVILCRQKREPQQPVTIV